MTPQYAIPNLAPLAQQFRGGTLDAPAYAGLYVLQWQVARYGRAVAQRRSRRDPPPDGIAGVGAAMSTIPPAQTEFLADLYARYELRGVRRRVGATLCRWLRGEWRLTLLEQVPHPCALAAPLITA